MKKGTKVRVMLGDVGYPGSISIRHQDGAYGVVLDEPNDLTDADGFIDNLKEADLIITEPPRPLTKEELEHKAEESRKAAVDEGNAKIALQRKEKQDALANTPLTDNERAFIAETKPKLKYGRRDLMPSPADMLRYSQLIQREKVT